MSRYAFDRFRYHVRKPYFVKFINFSINFIILYSEDKQKKFASEKAEMNKSKEEAKVQLELAQQKERMAQAANREKFARIQFRLTDSSSIVNTFNPDQTFDAAKLFITNVRYTIMNF